MLSADPDFIERIKVDGCFQAGRFEAKDTVCSFGASPFRGEFVDLPFEIGNDRAMRPGQHCRDD